MSSDVVDFEKILNFSLSVVRILSISTDKGNSCR